ncbi:MAG: pyridoxal-phosphate dependent enzyme [Cyanobacteria bacterium SZAS LIN-2]|nr:pyridoxal-phosphate dependent enzyme [Cyanobacteria bacterium SZAS LIN-2]
MTHLSDTERNPPAAVEYQINPKMIGLKCTRCGELFGLDLGDTGLGCSSCLEQGFPASLACAYENLDHDFGSCSRSKKMTRFGRYLPYESFPTLGEGNTAVLPLAGIAQSLGIAHLWLKNEGQNPTGSHKDRMTAVCLARAIELGKQTVVAASSGNAGASLAAYASAAGLRSVIVCSEDIAPAWAGAISAHGGELHKLKSADERWPHMRKLVEEDGFYPVTNFLSPPVGSNPFGIEGYKTIAYEIFEDLEHEMPTAIVIPNCRGDVMAGIYYGFRDLVDLGLVQKLPRLIAAEPGPRLVNVLSGSDYRGVLPVNENHLTSIGGNTATFQAFNALVQTKGTAVAVDNEAAVVCRKLLARHGLYLELSAAAALAGAEKLAALGYFDTADNVLLLGTSHGYKEPREVDFDKT